LAGLVLWEGNLFDNLIGTRWGYGVFQYSNDKFLNWITVGTQLNIGNFTTELDYYFGSRYMDYSAMVNNDAFANSFVRDQSVSLNLKYNFGQWRPSIKGVWNQRFDQNLGSIAYQTAGIQAVVEYYPFANNNFLQDLRFHAMYAYSFTDFKGNFASLEQQNNHTFLIGMRWLFKAK